MKTLSEKANSVIIKAYLAYKNALTSKKGSPSMEYIFILAVGAIVAGVLAAAFKDGGGAIKGKFIEKIKQSLDSIH